MTDTILCSDKEDAKKTLDAIGMRFVEDWEYLEDGKVRLILADGWKKGQQDGTE